MSKMEPHWHAAACFCIDSGWRFQHHLQRVFLHVQSVTVPSLLSSEGVKVGVRVRVSDRVRVRVKFSHLTCILLTGGVRGARRA